MNSKSLLITVMVSAFAGAAFADAKTPTELQQEAQLPAPSTTTRAAVKAGVPKDRADATGSTHTPVYFEIKMSCIDDLNAHALERVRCGVMR